MAQIDVLNKSEDTSPDKTKYQKSDLEEDGGISSHGNVDRYGYSIVRRMIYIWLCVCISGMQWKRRTQSKAKQSALCERNFILRV